MTVSRAELDAVFRDTDGGVTFSVTVLPRSSKCALAGIYDGGLKVKLTRPPVDGEANSECCRFLAKLLGLAKSQVAIARGATSKRKHLQAAGITASQACERVAAVMPSPQGGGAPRRRQR